ncbi:MAG: tagaturonate reductase [Bacteroidetes bacterium]|nr:tagaturonate reductase [Fibrella sp.]
MPQLNRQAYPAPFLPEKVLQFGTGVLLRGLPDYLIDKANKQGLFNGSIVVVKSTDADVDAFTQQDNRYTVRVQGTDTDDKTVVTAISRVMAAQTQWAEVLTVARNPNLQIIISNTTEIGLSYVNESIFQSPPHSFPAKLTAFLYERFRNVGGAKSKGMVVIPTELVVDNGLKLRNAVETLAVHNDLGKLFTKWLKYHVRFCNSLVDRIVTAADAETMPDLGYEDTLFISTEPYHLWAIEGDDRVRQILSFVNAHPAGMIIDEDINFYRERKLRVLNGGHTITVPLAYLLGLETVFDMSQHASMRAFLERVLFDEIVPTVPADALGDEGPAAVRQFATDVISRFSNPHIEHLLLNITVQQTAKMQARNVLTIQRHYETFGAVPAHMALGFASYLRFMRVISINEKEALGEISVGGSVITYPIRDAQARYFYERWQPVDAANPASVRAFVQAVCADDALWQTDLSALPGFVDAVADALNDIFTNGPEAALRGRLASSQP